ncbi:DedA family protein [Streptomyces sp. NRRL WC-3742]|uniref:DedA family protein n=1 Tax=Streptomyces sp. NRRL WC-3742 TaxID=1463934 RepID=UPI000691BE91|nr:VTT domain-containing protein [Streptomyces sp. NRRL WC-3742]
MDFLTAIGSSWICALAICAVLGDALLPFIPSGTLVILAVLKTAQVEGAPIMLGLGVAVASFLGDVLLLQLARRGAPVLQRRLARRPKLAASVARVQQALVERPHGAAAAMVVVARFVPAGRTVLDVAIGHGPHHHHRFLHWSALAALVWAAYIVTLGWLNSHWFNTAWLSLAVSCAAATAVSTAIARVVRRNRRPATL